MQFKYIGAHALFSRGERVISYKNGNLKIVNGLATAHGKLAAELMERDDFEQVPEAGAPLVRMSAPVAPTAPAAPALAPAAPAPAAPAPAAPELAPELAPVVEYDDLQQDESADESADEPAEAPKRRRGRKPASK